MNSLRFRLLLLFFLLAGGGHLLLIQNWTDSIRPAHLRSMEETLVDTATLLASAVTEASTDGVLNLDALRATLTQAEGRRLNAKIYELTKTQVQLRVYVTDARGVVLYDTASPGEVGQNYSSWNDVARTLNGQYGARSTRKDPDDPRSSTIYVASPITHNGTIIGVLGVGKHVDSLSLFIDAARRNILKSAIVVAVLLALSIGLVVIRITRPIQRLTEYASAVGRGERPTVPPVSGKEMKTLAAAFEDMRDELEGKKYVEHYVEHLTHEMKSPITAIRANTELLREEAVPPDLRNRFLANVTTEVERLQLLVDRMLQLAELESRKQLEQMEEVDLRQLIHDCGSAVAAGNRAIVIQPGNEAAVIAGDSLLIRQAVANLLQNAVDFTPDDGVIEIAVVIVDHGFEVRVRDNGTGLPPYALTRATERFFSTPRPGSGRKSSGLGLAFVAEIAKLHNGHFAIANIPEGGAIATLTLPAR